MVRKELCIHCGGLGTFWTERWDDTLCTDCHGKGKISDSDGKSQNCESCAGMGTRLVRRSDIQPCPYCLGRGHLTVSEPQSTS